MRSSAGCTWILRGAVSISPSDADVQRMRELARYDTKNPSLLFDKSREPQAVF
jgi:hypothetical protein